MHPLTDRDIRRLAQTLSSAAERDERHISEILSQCSEVLDAELPDLGDHVATKGHIRRTIEAKLEADLELSSEDVAHTVFDVLRYSIVLPEDTYADGIELVTERLQEEGFRLVTLNNYWEWPTYQGIDAVHEGNGFRFKVRFHTPESWQALQTTHQPLYDDISELSPGSRAVGKDFGEDETVEVFYFADVYRELGYPPEHPAGLYCVLTTPDKQVACYLSHQGWKPSSQIELWIAAAEPSVSPIDSESAHAILDTWVDDDTARLP